MKYKLVSDSHDALTGMRLAGIEGVFVSSAAEAEKEIGKCIDDEEIGIVLVTERLAESCAELPAVPVLMIPPTKTELIMKWESTFIPAKKKSTAERTNG